MLFKPAEGWQEGNKLCKRYRLETQPQLQLEAGNKVFKWGKGYAWSPVAFVDRPKNPEDPEELRQGFTIFTADWNQSFGGALKNAALSAVGVPVYKHVNTQFGELNHMNFASKLYLLLYDTDIDFMVSTGSSRSTRFGFDFSRNITTNLEIHGEWARINNFKLNTINAQGVATTRQWNAISYLLGLRYLSPQETTYIFEYYHNGTGVTQNQFQDFVTFTNNSYDTFLSTGNDSGLNRASQLAEGVYGRPNPMRDYLYFRASQKEPFDILYFTPALTSISLAGRKLVVTPELPIVPRPIWAQVSDAGPRWGKGTEYGEKQNDYRIDFSPALLL
jgi:hypothetical protein